MKKILLLTLATLLILNGSEKSKQKNLILFDWHGVVVHQSTKKAIKAFFNLNHKFAFLKNVIKQDKTKSIGYNTNKAKDPSIYPLLNCHEIDPEMANAIKKLKAKGYKIGIFSNIDKDSLKWSSEKDKKIKEIIDLVDFVYVAEAKNNFKTKNCPKTFDACKKQIKSKIGEDTRIIFIDDSKKNIEEGQKRGFKTHYYKSIKKFKEFIQELLNVKI